MRVITGSARGRRLKALEGQDVRPTTDRVKEAVFSIIQCEIEGRNFLDLFAGSGQMGIEALSRGAAKAVFIDEKKSCIDIIKQNLVHTGLSDKAVVLNTGSLSFAKRPASESFDIAFLDPQHHCVKLSQFSITFLPLFIQKNQVLYSSARI